MAKTYPVGIVTSYGAAKRAGYKGTYDDFCKEQAWMEGSSRVILNGGGERSTLVQTVGIPQYVDDISQYADYGLTETGWYVFCRIMAKFNATVTAETEISGDAGHVAILGNDYIDVAVRFGVTAEAQTVNVNWGEYAETYVFTANDLAVRNLDYRVTFYVYDAAEFTRWEYARTTDTTFSATKHYYLKNGDEYTLAEVTADEAVPTYYEETHGYALTTDTTFQDGTTYYTLADGEYTAATVTAGEEVPADTYYVATSGYAITEDESFQEGKTYYTLSDGTYTAAEVTAGETIVVYYNHSKVIFEGMTRNVTYRLDTPIDCPMEFILPEVEDETHGCWFEIRCHHEGEYSMTLTVPSPDVKIATEHTQKETAGINMIDLHYTNLDGVKLWRFLNTHSSIPT